MTGMDWELDRRALLGGAGAAGIAGIAGFGAAEPALAASRASEPPAGWERGPMRWFQLAFTEDDIGRFSPQFWLDYFREIHADGVVLSAGGGIAFYPTRVPGHGTARGLGGRTRLASWQKLARPRECGCWRGSIRMR